MIAPSGLESLFRAWRLSAALIGLSFALVVILTRPLIGWLRARQLGKAIRLDGPDHATKAGTPTLGGLAMLGVIALAGVFLLLWPDAFRNSYEHRPNGALEPLLPEILIILAAILAFAILGLLDDLAGLAPPSSREVGVGLTARQMFLLQVLAAAGIGWWMASVWDGVSLRLILARDIGGIKDSGTLLNLQDAISGQGRPHLLLSILAIVGTANGTNMADGLDGLAAGLAALAYGALGGAIVLRFGWIPVGVLALAISAACLGFLVYNHHPARVFMGNVTSMALGAGLATIALIAGMWSLLPVIGAVFVIEVLSDIIQVVYFKWSGGRRVFRMAPIHHHFELGGWSESKVVHSFWLAGLVAALAGLVLSRAQSPWPTVPLP